MRILGIGVDIISNKRIQLLTNNKNFISRTFGKNELKLSRNIKKRTNFFAKRFAAKEAFSKCIGSGFRNNLNFKDIQIFNDKLGKPFFLKSKKIDTIIFKKFNIKKYDLFLSISDEKDYSIAFTILFKQ
tara:strand:- start:584 stop:970 length:387 start_codon:yes stop_codon:yes gene_type:complete